MRLGVSDECGKAACVKIKWVNKGRLKFFRRPVYVMMIY